MPQKDATAHAAATLAWYHANKDKPRVRRLRLRSKTRYRYGITEAQRLQLFEDSDGLCAICYEEPATEIDHDHTTGRVRGAVCNRCNKGLGFIEAKPALLDVDWYLNP